MIPSATILSKLAATTKSLLQYHDMESFEGIEYTILRSTNTHPNS